MSHIRPWLTLVATAWLVSEMTGVLRAQETPALPSGLRAISERISRGLPIPFSLPGLLESGDSEDSPGLPPRGGRPIPGSRFDPGASGPGIGSKSREQFLGGALDPRTGWPLVFLHFFAPKPQEVERFWIVQTRECPQVMGSDPWPKLKVLHFDKEGELVERDPRELFAQTIGRPVFIQVQGSLTTPDIALGGLMWSQAWLPENRVLPPDAVVIAFDWPSQRVYQNDLRDINEKGRRAYVAGFHLASFLLGFPRESRISVLGQSYGGRVVPSALHLLGGGCLDSQNHDPQVRLQGTRPDLHIRAMIVEGASDHNWLDPDERFGRALHGCEQLLNIYNRRDEALVRYPFLIKSGHRKALGRRGMTQGDFDRIGPLAAKYEEHDVHDLLGREHTLLDAVANRQISRWMAPYLWAADPGPISPRPHYGPIEQQNQPSAIERLFNR